MAEAPTYQSRRASGAATAKEKLTGWSDPRISQERILGLLARGHSLALAVR